MTHPPPAGAPKPLTAEEINQLDLVEVIMRAPLDQAVTIAVGRASTCWTDVDGTFGMASAFDDQTANRIIDSILARISAELAVAVAEARGEDAARALIPTLAFPTEVHDRQQCPEVLRLEGNPHHSRCLLLEGHDGGEHLNGSLRWCHGEHGGVTAWWDSVAYQTLTLGELIRSQNIALQLPHLPAGAADADVKGELTPPEPPAVPETAPDTEEPRRADKP